MAVDSLNVGRSAHRKNALATKPRLSYQNIRSRIFETLTSLQGFQTPQATENVEETLRVLIDSLKDMKVSSETLWKIGAAFVTGKSALLFAKEAKSSLR